MAIQSKVDGLRKQIKIIDTQGGHYGIILETWKKGESLLFLCSYKAVRKVHEINCHKKKEQLIAAYQNIRWMRPEMVDTIKRVVQNCKACQKFEKSLARPGVRLPEATSFNEVVTMDLKEFGSKYICKIILMSFQIHR